MKKHRYFAAYTLLCILLVSLILLNICIGSVNVPFKDIPAILLGAGQDETYTDIVMQIRYPRALAAAILGGGLALSGYLLQTFFHNPIAGPFTLGITTGAKLVVALVMVAALGNALTLSSWVMILAAFAGAMLCMGFVILMSRVMDQMAMLIVSGVMIGYICSAITDFVVTFADDADIVNLHNWSKLFRDHMAECICYGDRDSGNVGWRVFDIKAVECLSDGRSLCKKHGIECTALQSAFGAFVKYFVCLCDSVCRAGLFCGYCSAASG